MNALNGSLERSRCPSGPFHGAGVAGHLASKNGRERIELIDLRNGIPVPTPGLNRADAQPVVSLSGMESVSPLCSNVTDAPN